MNMDGNELSLNDLEKVSGGIMYGRNPFPKPHLPIPVPVRGGHSGKDPSIGGDNTSLGSDGPADGGSGGYLGDGNYLHTF